VSLRDLPVINFVVSDHSPWRPQLKQRERSDFHAAHGGIASLQLELANVWTHARQRGATPVELTRWTSHAPTPFAGLKQRKGRLAIERDADFVWWDPDALRGAP
jgi:allantoinase